MIRRRTQTLNPDLNQNLNPSLMEPSGSSGRTEPADFMDADSDDELLVSVSHITEHLNRNLTVVLDSALNEIRTLVSVRIRVLQNELREKTREVQSLKARLDTTSFQDQDQDQDQYEEQDSGFKKMDYTKSCRPRPLQSGVKKENIDAICDHLMKTSRGGQDQDHLMKTSRGGQGPELVQNSDRETQEDPDTQSLHLWSGPTDSDSTSEDLFNKRVYDYDWIQFSSDLRGMKESEEENPSITETEEEQEEEEGESSRRESGSLDQDLLSHSSEFMDDHRDPGEGGGPEEGGGRPAGGGPQFPAHTFICSLCGTFCPDAVYLEEHIKLLHLDSADPLQVLQSTCPVPSTTGGKDESGRGLGGQDEAGSGSGTRGGMVPVKREVKMEGGYECGDCGRHFNYLGNLRQHQRIHTGEKPFMCPECGERFRHAARLKSHRLVHSGAQSPFPCPQCGKGFSVLSGLKRHQRVHTGESPYACPQCGRRFKELGNLYTHQRIHSGATPYCCNTCGRSFRHLGTYKSHRCTPNQ